MRLHKRMLLWLLIRVMPLVNNGLQKLPKKYRERIYALVGKLFRYVNDQPTLYGVSQKQVDRAEELYNMAGRHYNALLKEGATEERIDGVRYIYQFAELEKRAADEAHRLNMTMEVSDMEDAADEKRGP